MVPEEPNKEGAQTPDPPAKVTVPTEAGDVDMTQAELIEAAKSGIGVTARNSALDRREKEIAGTGDAFAGYQRFQQRLQSDPQAALAEIQTYVDSVSDGVTTPPGGTSQSLSGESETADLVKEIKHLSQRLERQEGRGTKTEEKIRQSDLQTAMAAQAAQFPDLAKNEAGTGLFNLVLTSVLAANPGADLDTTAQVVHTNMKRFLATAADNERAALEPKANLRTVPLIGSPQLTPMENPPTHTEYKKDKAKVLDRLKSRLAEATKQVANPSGGV